MDIVDVLDFQRYTFVLDNAIYNHYVKLISSRIAAVRTSYCNEAKQLLILDSISRQYCQVFVI